VPAVEVIDPRHPLFGRRFPLRSLSAPSPGASHVFVAYRGYMTLRLPLAATNLLAPRPSIITKLTHAAVVDLLALAETCGGPCLSNPMPSGDAYRQTGNTASPKKSRPSAAR
jgi:hypothetical protein